VHPKYVIIFTSALVKIFKDGMHEDYFPSYGLVIFSGAVFFVKLPGNKILIEMSSLLRQKKSSRVIIINDYFPHNI
jgi:hypothetical protein